LDLRQEKLELLSTAVDAIIRDCLQGEEEFAAQLLLVHPRHLASVRQVT
jgi:hypothetical protein